MNTGMAIVTGLCLTAGMALAQSNAGGSIFSDSGILNEGGESSFAASPEMEEAQTSLGSLSIRAGYVGNKDDDFLDYGAGGQMEFRIGLGDTPADFVLRAHYNHAKFDDYYIYGYYGDHYERLDIENEEHNQYGGSMQLLFNFNKDGLVNPYVSVGGMYDKIEVEADYWYYSTVYYWWYSYRNYNYGTIELDDDGFGFVGRLGLEFNPRPLYVRLEGAFVSKMHKGEDMWFEDKGQAELNAILGANVTDSLRIDISGTYFTHWKDYYVMAGLTYLFL